MAVGSATRPLFNAEGPQYYAAAYRHNRPFAKPPPYQTNLTVSQEKSFRAWVVAYRVPFDPNAGTVDYDMRGYWLATGGKGWQEGDHFPDTYKTPYDTTFSKESKYALPQCPFEWRGDMLVDSRDGTVIFNSAAPAVGTTERNRRRAAAPGRRGARDHPRAKRRKTVPKNYWQRDASPLRHVGEEEFRVWALRRGVEHVLLGGVAVTGRPNHQVEQWGGLVTEITWDDVSAILTGQLTLQREPYNRQVLDVFDGDEIRLEYRAVEGGKWQELWTMRCKEPNYDLASGAITFQLENDLAILDQSIDDFNYQKSKKKPNGWLVHEAIADLCQRYGLKYRIVRCKHRLKKQGVGRAVSPWEFVKKLMNYEVNATGRKLMLRYERGALTMQPLLRSPHMLELGPTLIAAALAKPRHDRFATAVTVRSPNWDETAGKDTKGHKKRSPRKVFVKYTNHMAAARFGYVHRILYSPDAVSQGELLEEGKLYVAEVIKAQRTLTITHPGIPSLKRGHSMQIAIESEDFKQIVYAKELHFRVGGGEFFMDVVCALEDPYVDDKAVRILDKLTDTPAARGRTSEKSRTKKKGKKKTKKTDKTGASNTTPAPAPTAPTLTPGQRLAKGYGG